MHRLAFAVLAVAVAAALVVFLARSAARSVENRGGLSALTTGGTMQKIAFFLLLCLIVYVSVTGAA